MSSIKRVIILAALSSLALPAAVSAGVDPPPLDGLTEYIIKSLGDWQVPGLAISVVKDDKIVFAEGFGVRGLGSPVLVDTDTLFAIGSASKAFTAAGIAMLVDEGKLKWDDHATKNLPQLQFFDPYVTHEMTVRDLLCHRSGLSRGEPLWYGTSYTRNEILQHVQDIEPTWSYRSMFGYQNIMFLAAGQTIAAISGKSWDEFIRERIFIPLGMKSTTTSVITLEDREDIASPHAKIEETVQRVRWRNIDNIAPAGSINSSVTEMAQWVRLQLGDGEYEGKRLISAAAVKEMHTPQMIIRREGPYEKLYPESHFYAYGLGWFLQDYHGKLVVQHGGNIDGMSALVAMVPEEKLGMVILTNMNGTQLPTAVAFRVIDKYLGGGKRDWSADLLKVIKGYEAQAKLAEKKHDNERVKDTHPSLPLKDYAGTYESKTYGKVAFEEKEGKLLLHRNAGFDGDLEHWHFDTFQAKFHDPMLAKMMITFSLDGDGHVATAKIGDLGDYARVPVKKEEKKSD